MGEEKPVMSIVPRAESEPMFMYPPETLDTAYQLWALKCGQDAGKVAALLKDDHQWREAAGLTGTDRSPDRATIKTWSISERWLERFHDDMNRMGGSVLYTIAQESLMATMDGVRILRSIMNNEGEDTRNRLKAIELASAPIVGREKIVGAVAKPLSQGEITTTEWREMSKEELRERSRRLQEELRKQSG